MKVVDGEWVFGCRRTVRLAVLMQRYSDLRWLKTKPVKRRRDRHTKLCVCE